MKMPLKAIAVNKHSHQDNRGLRRLNPKMICLFGQPESLAALGRFLIDCGKEMKKPGPFHRHFRDYLPGWSTEMLDVTAERPVEEKRKRTANHAVLGTARKLAARDR